MKNRNQAKPRFDRSGPTGDLEKPVHRPDIEFPRLLDLGGHEAFPRYQEAFNDLVLARQPILDPRGHRIVFKADACTHVCFNEPRFEKGQRRIEGWALDRDHWDQERADAISWIHMALTDPSAIVRNNRYPRNEVYLLGSPRNNPKQPSLRYFVSVRPVKGGDREFKTAYRIDQRQWDDARQGNSGPGHVLYQRASHRY